MRVRSLEGIRILAVLVIAFSHLVELQVFGYFAKSNSAVFLSVNYLFILSGFGLFLKFTRSYSNNRLSGIKFAIFQIKKIYPVYMFSMLACVPYSIIMDIKEDGLSLMRAILKACVKFLGGGTLLQAITGSSVTSHALNAVCWFLSCLFICYMFCPKLYNNVVLLSKRINNFEIKGFVWCVGMIVGVSRVAIHLQDKLQFEGLKFNAIEYVSPFVRIWYILLGMLLGAFYMKYKDVLVSKPSEASLIEVALVILIAVIIYIQCYIDFSWIVRTVVNIIIPMFAVMIFSLGNGVISKILEKEFLINWARKSSLVYLWHYPVLAYVKMVFVNNNLLSYSWKMCGILLSAVLIGLIVKCVEWGNYVWREMGFKKK